MTNNISFLETYKPGIPKRYLLFVAAFMWTFAGGMLLYRGFSSLKLNTSLKLLEELVSIIFGIIFYVFMFSRISLKHINRILNINIDRPCFFSFFNWHSYFLMSIMISSGIILRITGIVPITYLAYFYIAMGTPLFISSLRFYYSGLKNLK